jgi:hypothetical protein
LFSVTTTEKVYRKQEFTNFKVTGIINTTYKAQKFINIYMYYPIFTDPFMTVKADDRTKIQKQKLQLL